MKAYLYLFFAFILVGTACKDSATQTATNPKTAANPNPAPAAVPIPKKPKADVQYPGIDPNILATLFADSDYLDYIFHDLPFSMSQDEQASIQSTLRNFSPEPAGIIPGKCKPIARQMFSIKGEIVREFDVYYSDGCAFFAQVEGSKTIAANKMTPSGENFFKSMIEQAMKTRQQMGQ